MGRSTLARLKSESGRAELAADLFAAVEDDAAWGACLTCIGAGLSATTVTHHTYDHREKHGTLGIVAGMSEQFAFAYQQHFSSLNAWVLHGSHLISPGDITVSHQMYSDEALYRSEWFNDWCRPQGMYSVMSAVLTRDADIAFSISFGRGSRAGHFNDDEQYFLRSLVPHIERTWRLRRRLAEAGNGASLELAVLDKLTAGVVLLDAKGHMIGANSAATTLLAQGDGLVVRGNQLVALISSARRVLDAAVTQAVGECNRLGPFGATFCVGRRSLAPPYEVWVVPISGARCLGPDRPHAAVFITDPESRAALDPVALRALYRLTVAESRVACTLAACASVEGAAESLGLSIETVRSHLNKVRRKVGVSSSAELVGRLVTGAASLTVPSGRVGDPRHVSGPASPTGDPTEIRRRD